MMWPCQTYHIYYSSVNVFKDIKLDYGNYFGNLVFHFMELSINWSIFKHLKTLVRFSKLCTLGSLGWDTGGWWRGWGRVNFKITNTLFPPLRI